MFNAAGEASSVRTQSFYKKDESLLTSLSCHAWIDNNEDNAVTFCPVGDIVMDAPGLDFGMHNLHVVLLNVNGEKLIEKTVQFEVEDPDGVTFIPASALEDGAMFNVAGQRIQRMPKGIYIKGGKKVLVK